MRPRRAAKLIAGALALAVFVALWLFTAPTSLGGATTWVVTDGVSMEPRFHGGDLAIVRSEPTYRVGQVVAYDNNQLHTIVLHRIIGREGGRYVFKGDNNNFADFEHPAQSQLLGALWLHVPGLGSRLQSVRSPGLAGGLLALAFLLIAGGVFVGRRRARGRDRRGGGAPALPAPANLSAAPWSGVAAAACVAALPFLLLGALAFTRPATALQPYHLPYRQAGAFSYTAQADPGPTYEAGHAVTGEPLFTHVVHEAQLHFAYRFHSAAPHSLHGKIALRASVVSTSGWHTMLPLAQPQPFSGDRGTVSATLRLEPLLAVVHRVEAATQVSGTYTLTLLPSVTTAGTLAGVPVHTRFAPQLALSLAPLEITPVVSHPRSPLAAAPGLAASSFLPSSAGTASGRSEQPVYLSFGPLRVSVAAARAIALGAIVLIALATAGALALMRPRRRDDSATIMARYGRMIVPVARVREQPGVGVIDVADIDALARIAEHYDRSILFESTPAGDAFWVSDESGQFRYTTTAGVRESVRAQATATDAQPSSAQPTPGSLAQAEPPVDPRPAFPAEPLADPFAAPEPEPPAAPVIREIKPGPEEVWHEPGTPPTADWPVADPVPAPPEPPAAVAAPPPTSAWAEEQMREIHRLAEQVYADELALAGTGERAGAGAEPQEAPAEPEAAEAETTAETPDSGVWPPAPGGPRKGSRGGGLWRRGRRTAV